MTLSIDASFVRGYWILVVLDFAKSVEDFPSGARCNTRIRWCMSPWPSTSTSPWFRRCRSRLRCLKSNIKMRSWRFPFRSLALMGTYTLGYEWLWWTIYCSQQYDIWVIWVEHETFLPCAANPSRVKLSNNAELPFWEKWNHMKSFLGGKTFCHKPKENGWNLCASSGYQGSIGFEWKLLCFKA